MAFYCTECGNILSEGANFCGKCGRKTFEKQDEIRLNNQGVYCQNCGTLLKNPTPYCEFCGARLHSSIDFSYINEFVKDITGLHEERSKAKSQSVFSLKTRSRESIEDELNNYIINYQIPNDISQLTEFMIFAASNVNTNVFLDEKQILGLASSYDYQCTKRESLTWLSKMDQILNKASILFYGTPGYQKIYQVYCGVQNNVKEKEREKKAVILRTWAISGISVLLMMIILIILIALTKK